MAFLAKGMRRSMSKACQKRRQESPGVLRMMHRLEPAAARMAFIASPVAPVVAFHQALVFGVSDDRLDGVAALEGSV